MNNKCNKFIEYLNENKKAKLSIEIKEHIRKCEDCHSEWKNYKQMIMSCHSFPKIIMTDKLQESLNNISRKGNYKRLNRFENISAVASIILVFTLFMYFFASSAPIITKELPSKSDIWIHKAYSKVIKIFYQKDVIIGNVQYMSLPATMKMQEIYSSLIKEDNEKNKQKEELNIVIKEEDKK